MIPSGVTPDGHDQTEDAMILSGETPDRHTNEQGTGCFVRCLSKCCQVFVKVLSGVC